MRILTFVFVEWLDGRAPIDAGADDLSGKNSGLRTDDGSALNTDVIAEAT